MLGCDTECPYYSGTPELQENKNPVTPVVTSKTLQTLSYRLYPIDNLHDVQVHQELPYHDVPVRQMTGRG